MKLRKLEADEIRGSLYMQFWEAESWLYWTGTVLVAAAAPAALWGYAWWWWAIAGTALHGLRVSGAWFFRPVPRWKRRA